MNKKYASSCKKTRHLSKKIINNSRTNRSLCSYSDNKNRSVLMNKQHEQMKKKQITREKRNKNRINHIERSNLVVLKFSSFKMLLSA